MTIAANLDPANIQVGISDAKLNLKSRPGTPQALNGRDQSFGERWQSLLDLDETAAGKQITAQAADLNQSPSSTIADLQEGPGATIRANHSGEIESHPRARHQDAEGSQHKAPSTKEQTGIGAIEANSAGTLLVLMIQGQVVAPERYQTTNANQQTGSIESTSPIASRQLRTENLTESHSTGQGTGDSLSLAVPTTKQMAIRGTDVTRESAYLAQKASEASGNGETVESTQPLSGTSVAGDAVTARAPGADNPATNVARLQLESAPVASNPAASNQGIDIRNATEAATRPAPATTKGTAFGNPSTPSEQVSIAHFASAQAPHNSLGHPEQLPQQQPDTGFAHSSIVPAAANREPGTSLPPQTPSSPEPTATVHQTFAALDAEDSTATSKWVRAGGNTAEAGFEDPVLGWVGVRAQAGPSGVHATVVPISADAAQSLGAHLSGLSSYLSEHRTPVETVTMSAPDSSLGQHSMGQRGGNPSEQEADQSGIPSPAENTGTTSRSPHQSVIRLDSNGATMIAQLTVQGGTYVSVLA
jgi:hypothetical protein